MSVHYKFKNTINYDAVKFDGVYISASDLKSIIVQQKKLGHSELQVENEETGQLYTDDQMIPKNTNIIVSRLPFANSNKRSRLSANQPYPNRFSGNANSSGTTSNLSSNSGNINSSNNHHNHHHHHNNHHHQFRHPNHHNLGPATSTLLHSSSSTTSSSSSSGDIGGVGGLGSSGAGGGGREAMELVSNKDMSEEDRKKYIQKQSTKDFDPARYARGNRGGYGGAGGRGAGRPHHVGPGYTCRKCGIPGHSIYDCKSSAMHKVKRSSGIPRDFLMKVDSKEKGALMTPSGEYAVPIIDREAYNNPKVEKAPFFEDGTPSDDNTTTASKEIVTKH